MQKKAISYLRFSHEGQSNSSIERQELITSQWAERMNVEITDTFADAGHSAKTFDRPDFQKLQDFIKQHHRSVDYLIVDQMDRFSRDAGEALSMIKKLQSKYSIQVVSATEGITFDYHTPGSFFRAGLQFLLAEEDNINRASKINAGIYTAKAKEGRYIYGHAPFGYKFEGQGKSRHLVINEEQAKVVTYIFNAYLTNTPDYIIRERAAHMGLKHKGNSVVKDFLTNPIYAGHQVVKPYKDLPGGIFPALHKGIVDMETWSMIQQRLKGGGMERVIIDDNLPLRGVLKCHCQKPLTGAPSRGRHGKYYLYYKCRHKGHNNISATKAHEQLHEILKYMSLPQRLVAAIKDQSEKMLQERMKDNRANLSRSKRDMEELEQQLYSVEEKYIKNQMAAETYHRWLKDLTRRRVEVKSRIERFSKNGDSTWKLLSDHLSKLTDLQYVYNQADTLKKQELIRLGFDNELYYEDKTYRTPFVLPIFEHNLLT
ncbi:recombinase family protein, partial [Cnuella takakiae]